MVSVGNKVVVAPMEGQPGNLVVISAGGGVSEGNFNTWTKQWVHYIPHGLNDEWNCECIIDELHDTLMMGWDEEREVWLGPHYYRFGVFNLADFSTVFLSPGGENYLDNSPTNPGSDGVKYRGSTNLGNGGMCTTAQSYLMIFRNDGKSIEVWRGGASPLWSIDLSTVFIEDPNHQYAGFSVSGKWIIARNQKDGIGQYKSEIACFKGSYVEP